MLQKKITFFLHKNNLHKNKKLFLFLIVLIKTTY